MSELKHYGTKGMRKGVHRSVARQDDDVLRRKQTYRLPTVGYAGRGQRDATRSMVANGAWSKHKTPAYKQLASGNARPKERYRVRLRRR